MPVAESVFGNTHSKVRRAEEPYLESLGTPAPTRTGDPRLRRPLLYPAELRALEIASSEEEAISQSGREDLNLRHPAPKAGALPDCATPRAAVNITFNSATTQPSISNLIKDLRCTSKLRRAPTLMNDEARLRISLVPIPEVSGLEKFLRPCGIFEYIHV